MHTDAQTLIAAALVLACGGYAAWSLMPSAWQRRLAVWSGRPLPAASACGACGGCSGAPAARPAAANQPDEAVIQIVRRPPR